MPTDLNQLVSFVEYAALILSVALGLARIGLAVWASIDHGHPDARRDWVQRAVQLAVQATGQADQLLGVGAGTPIEDATCQDIARRAEKYLADHGLPCRLDPETIRLVVAELRAVSGTATQPPATSPA